MRSYRSAKSISRILIFAVLHLCWLTSHGWAEMVPTNSAVQSQEQTNTNRQLLLDLLKRQEGVEQLEKYGISKVEAIARINSLTDEEIEEFSTKIDQLPRGGQNDWGAAILFVVIFFPILIIGWSFDTIFPPSSSPFPATKESLDPSQGASCLEPCYSDLNECMSSSENSTEENECEKDKTMCTQQCEGNFN